MGRVSGPLKSSANAGQLSANLRGKVNLKQYYSGALRMLGYEPVPQSGFTLLPGSRLAGTGLAGACVHGTLKVDAGRSYTIVVLSGRAEIWRNDRVRVATVTLSAITAAMLPDLEFYGEANTFGIFHPDLWNGLRLLRNPANDTLWTVSAWPYGKLPDVDLGGDYTKKTDKWEFHLRYTDSAPSLVMALSIDGETTDGATLKNGGSAVPPAGASDANFTALASDLQTKARVLAGMTNDLTVVFQPDKNQDNYRVFAVTFGGALSGAEYDFEAQILNTSDASVLSSHIVIGKTAGEPIISAARGGFAGAVNFQDRQVYFAPKAKPAALAMSRTGEYFDLNIESQNDAAARLEAFRGEASETIIHVLDATYLLAFTDRAEYFASNRTIKRNEPINWVRGSDIGAKKGCKPVLLEGTVYFVSRDGGRLYATSYDAVSEIFAPKPVNDLNGDLVENVARMVVQRKGGQMANDRLWILREDGRLIAGMVNSGQDIPLAACEWSIAGDGAVRGISVDGQDRVWITVERNGVFYRETLEEASSTLFQMTHTVITDLVGRASGLAALNGRTVWAEIAGDIHGPFVVSGGVIETDIPSAAAVIGLWAAPVYESMPFVRVLPNDDVVRRPGKVVSSRIYVSDTTSIAVGANGRPAKDVPLSRATDDLSMARPPFTGHVTVSGLIGACMDPTFVITQVRPGRITVRDFIPGVKL